MATRVFLLSADEKAVHVITQILDEQDIRFEHSSDPTFTLKRLAGQHFEVLIVDCDNAESAMQVFNSARASSLNKGAIAIAIVEGKAGVPNAFRLGASLVLTKPVSLDQARNTLRTAVGMTRKDAVETRPAVAPPAPVAAAPTLVPVASVPVSPVPVAPVPVAPVSVAPAPVAPAPVAPAAPAPAAPAPVAPAPVAPAAHAPAAPAPAAPAPAAPAPGAPAPGTTAPSVVGPVAPAATSAPLPSVNRSPVITPKPFEVAASAPTPGVPSPAASVHSNTIVAERVPSLPAVKAPPLLQLAETRVFNSEASAPPLAPAKDPGEGHEKSPLSLSLSSAMLRHATSEAAVDKLEIAVASAKQQPTTANTLEMFAPQAKELTESTSDPIDLELEETAATLRASAVPAFGGLAQQPFAGIEPARGGRTWLISGALVAVACGVFAAAWVYSPDFQKIVTWEYARVHDQIQNWRGKSVPTAVPNKPAIAVQAAAPAPSSPVDQPASSTVVEQQTSSTPAPLAATANPPSQPVVPVAASASTPPSASPSAAPAKSKTISAPASGSPVTPTGTASLVKASATTAPAATAAPKPAELFEVPEDYADDQVIHRVHPAYPNVARAKKLQGTVVLQAIIDKQGKVDSLQLVSGDPLLAQAAANAVKQWRYKPYSHNGDPAEFQTRVTVDFKLP